MRVCSNDRMASLDTSNRSRTVLLVMACALALHGCGDPVAALLTDDCDDEMNATRGELGEPQKITVAERVGDWRLVIWSYFERGFIREFEWGEIARGCKVTDKPLVGSAAPKRNAGQTAAGRP